MNYANQGLKYYAYESGSNIAKDMNQHSFC